MSTKPLSQAYKDLLYLIRCVVRQEQVDTTWSFQTPLATLFGLACFHSIEALLYDTVKQMPLRDEDKPSLKDWQVAHDKAFRRYLLFTTERQAILNEFEKAGIWHMPLKGVILQNDYPKPHHRQMSDNDILFDMDRRYDVKDIMVRRGYKLEHFHNLFDDAYHKEPFYNFEMHVRAGVAAEFSSYFESLSERLLSVSLYARQMTDEDFYLYVLSHELKHYKLSGTGLRSLIDLQFYVAKHGQALNWEAIKEVLVNLGVDRFDSKRRDLVFKLFSDDGELFEQVLDDDELIYYCTSGVYGTIDKVVDNRMQKENGTRHSFLSYYCRKVYMVYRFMPDYPILKTY